MFSSGMISDATSWSRAPFYIEAAPEGGGYTAGRRSGDWLDATLGRVRFSTLGEF